MSFSSPTSGRAKTGLIFVGMEEPLLLEVEDYWKTIIATPAGTDGAISGTISNAPLALPLKRTCFLSRFKKASRGP